MTAIIDIEKLCFRYDTREVLHDISLLIQPGMFAAMVGPNGGGKTTLLKLILGLLEPRFGTVKVFGKPPRESRRLIGYVPQSILFDSAFPASVLDVVLMGCVDQRSIGLFGAAQKRQAMLCLEEVGLADFAKRPFAALSGGERQRVLIAQALVSSPKLLLLDEPGANLDPVSAQRLYELLKGLNREMTILMVSHNLEVVSTVVSHIICINHTADMHPISQLKCDPLTGAWVHLEHSCCPVSDSYVHPHHHD